MTKVTELLKEAAKDVLTDETLQAIEQAFTESVDRKTEERSKIAVEAALSEQDEKYAEKLEELLEAIDKDHCRKLKKVVEAVDRDRANKLKTVIKKHRTELTAEATKLRDTVVDNISRYLDVYLEEAVPTESINEAVANKRAMKVLESFRETLSVDMALAQDSIRDGVLDGKKRLTESEEEVAKLAESNKSLEAELNELKIKSYIAENTRNFDEKKVAFISETFDGKSLDFIKENLNYTSRIFDRKTADVTEALKEEAVQESTLKSVDEKELTVESAAPAEEASTANPYMSELARLMQ